MQLFVWFGLFIYLLSAVLGFCCCESVSLVAASKGTLVVVGGLLIAVASLAQSTGSKLSRFQ